MRAGDLDRRVSFERSVLVDDGFARADKWVAHGDTIWAAKRDASDAEAWRASEVQASISARFTVRWSAFTADLTPKDRLICEGVTYDINGKKEIGGRRQWLELTCSARADK